MRLRDHSKPDAPDDLPLTPTTQYRVTIFRRAFVETKIVTTQAWRDAISTALQLGRSRT